MNVPGGQRPPRLAERLLTWCLPPGGRREGVLGDLQELYRDRTRAHSLLRARAWYWAQALRIGGGFAMRGFGIGADGGMHRAAETRDVPSGLVASKGRGLGMGEVARDIRFALRSYRRSPGFFAVAMVTLALGIGANTAIFSVVNGVYLRPLEFEEPDRLVRLGFAPRDGSGVPGVHTVGSFSYWRERSVSFQGMAAHAYRNVTAQRGPQAEQILTAPIIGSLFDVLGVEPALGRTFTAAEEGPGTEGLVVLSHGYWTQSFGADRDAVGAVVTLDGTPYTVIGVMPRGFTYPHPDVQAWTTAELDVAALAAHDDFYLRTVARLEPGRSLDVAREDMDRIARELEADVPQTYGDLTVPVVPLRSLLVGSRGRLWGVLMAGVGVVLLIACLNLATVLLSRAVRRERELAVRRSLGARQAQLVRQVLTESLVLAVLGGAAGLLTGWLFLKCILAWMPGGVPRVESVGMDTSVVLFTVLTSLIAGLLFGCFPAVRVGAKSVRERLGRNRGPSRLLAGLVAAEVGMAVVLLVVGGLTLRSFFSLSHEDPGVVVEDRVVFNVRLPADTDPAEGQAFYRGLEERLSGLPGVISVGMGSSFPVASFSPGAWVNEPGVVHDGGDRPGAKYQVVSPGYFPTLGVELVEGRLLTRGDGVDGSRSVVISRAAARELFGSEAALGKRFDLGAEGSIAPLSTVVGVVEDLRLRGLDQPAPPVVLGVQELMPQWSFGFEVFLHTAGSRTGLAAAVQQAVRELDSMVPFTGLRDAAVEMDAVLSGQRNTMLLFGLLATVALALAAIGLSGVLAFVVSQRWREIGIRMAIGADRSSVRGLVLRQGLIPVAVGIGAGVVLALALGRFVESLLFGVDPADPATFGAITTLLLAVATVAIYVPARRASLVDPVKVLGAE